MTDMGNLTPAITATLVAAFSHAQEHGVDYYLAGAPVNAHICPFCEDWTLEAPWFWPTDEVKAIFRGHLIPCADRHGLPAQGLISD